MGTIFFFIFWPFWRSLWPWTVSKVINQYIFFYFLSQTTFVSNFMTLPFIVPEFIILPFWGCQLWVEKWPKGVKAGACGLFHMILTAVFTGLTQTTIFGLDVYNKRFVQCPKTDCFSDPRKAHKIRYFLLILFLTLLRSKICLQKTVHLILTKLCKHLLKILNSYIMNFHNNGVSNNWVINFLKSVP